MFKFLKQSIINWCLKTKEYSIGEIFDKSNPINIQIPDFSGNLKFTAEGKTEFLIQTPSGWSKVNRVLKTIPYQIWKLQINEKELFAADEHLIITPTGEKSLNKLYLNDEVLTIDGIEKITKIEKTSNIEEMFDLELTDDKHIFYTNKIQSHNTILSSIYILWFSMFNSNKKSIIASKDMDHAVEIMSRIKVSYEELPFWLKAGCKFYNRTSIEFDNGSRIKCMATSVKTGRGESPAILYIDEISHISLRIQKTMWNSLAPSLSTGGKFIITSTPNGDIDLFANLWRGANSGTNSFTPFQAMWYQHPDRGQEYYNEMLEDLGELQFRQEILCEFISSDALLINSMRLLELKFSKPIQENLGFSFWRTDEQIGGSGKTYLVGIDPATGTLKDYSVIQVFEFPSLEQVIEYRTNEINIPLFYAKLKWILEKLSTLKGKGRANVIWSFERNGIGEALCALYYNDEKPPQYVELYNDSEKQFGVFTSGKSKLSACMQLKTLVEKPKNGLQLNSRIIIEELKNFISKGGSYEAKSGSTDDTVSALLIIVRLLKRLAEYDETAFNQVNEYISAEENLEDVEPMPFLMM